jgi:hypothetical protein
LHIKNNHYIKIMLFLLSGKNTASRGFFGMSFHISLHGCYGDGAQAAGCAAHVFTCRLIEAKQAG